MNDKQVSAMLIARGLSIETVKKVLGLRHDHDCLMKKTKREIVELQRKAILISWNLGESKILRGLISVVNEEKHVVEHYADFIKKRTK